MRLHCLTSFALLSILAACGGDSGAEKAKNSLGGHWAEHTEGGAKGMTIEFDSESDRLIVHTAPAEDGTHGHLSGTYAHDAGKNAVTVHCELLGTGKGDVWKGSVEGDHLTVKSGESKLTFHKGDNPHDHGKHK